MIDRSKLLDERCDHNLLARDVKSVAFEDRSERGVNLRRVDGVRGREICGGKGLQEMKNIQHRDGCDRRAPRIDDARISQLRHLHDDFGKATGQLRMLRLQPLGDFYFQACGSEQADL